MNIFGLRELKSVNQLKETNLNSNADMIRFLEKPEGHNRSKNSGGNDTPELHFNSNIISIDTNKLEGIVNAGSDEK